MATRESQNPTDGSPAILAADALPERRPVLTQHDWVTYAMVFAAALMVVGVPLVLLGSAWSHPMMILIGAVCYTIASVISLGIFGFFTWKVVETGRIAIPLLWRRIRR